MNAPDGAPQKIRLDTQRSKYDVICHLLSSGCAEPCLFLGTDAYPLRPQPAPLGSYFSWQRPTVYSDPSTCQTIASTKITSMA
jgi:hypothetical protein